MVGTFHKSVDTPQRRNIPTHGANITRVQPKLELQASDGMRGTPSHSKTPVNQTSMNASHMQSNGFNPEQAQLQEQNRKMEEYKQRIEMAKTRSRTVQPQSTKANYLDKSLSRGYKPTTYEAFYNDKS